MSDPLIPRNQTTGSPPDPLPDYDPDSGKASPFVWIGSLLADPRLHVFVAFLVLLLLAWLAAPPLYRQAKAWRAMDLIAQSQLARDAGDPAKSVALMRQALFLAPGDEQVLRAVQLFNAGQGDPSSVAALRERMDRWEASPEELLVLAEQTTRTGDPTTAGSALAQLPAEQSIRRDVVEARLLDLRGDRIAAVAAVRKAADARPGSDGDVLRLLLAELLLSSDANDASASSLILALSSKPSPEGLTALRFLARQHLAHPRTDGLPPLEIAALLARHPKHEIADTLLAYDLELLAQPDQAGTLLGRVASSHADAPRGEFLAIARWLNHHRAYRQALAFIGRDRALSDNDFFLVYLDATAGLDRWDDVRSLLEKEKISGISESIRFLFLARSSEKLNDPARADEAWRELQRVLPFEKAEDAAYVAAYAERGGFREQAIKAYWVLAGKKEAALQGFLGVIRCQPRSAPVSDVLPVYEALLAAFPNLAEARCDKAYLQLLNGSGIPEAVATGRELYRSNPSSLATLSVAALGALRQGDTAGAEALYDGKQIAWGEAPDQWKVVRIAVLRATWQNRAADELAATIRTENLRREERALLTEGR